MGTAARARELTSAETPQKRISQPSIHRESRLDRFRLGDDADAAAWAKYLPRSMTRSGESSRSSACAASDRSIMVRRFVREAKIQGCLDHPAIRAVHELGWDADGSPVPRDEAARRDERSGAFFATSSVPRSRESLLRAFVDVCLAVEFAHARGVLHRDIKPSNIMLGEFGEVYVLRLGHRQGRRRSNPDVAEVQRWSNDLG